MFKIPTYPIEVKFGNCVHDLNGRKIFFLTGEQLDKFIRFWTFGLNDNEERTFEREPIYPIELVYDGYYMTRQEMTPTHCEPNIDLKRK